MPQSAEHVDALSALGVRHGLLVVTRSDLLEPDLARDEARAHLAGTPLAGIPAVCVSAVTGEGMDDLRAALDDLAAALPVPDSRADVRLWVDRAFTIRGAGTVVTGTLPAGRLRVDDELELHSADHPPRRVTVRGLQSLGQPHDRIAGVARVAVNLRGVPREAVARGDVLLTPGVKRRELAAYVVGVDGHRQGRSKSKLIVEIEVNCQLTSNAIVGSSETTTNYRLAFTSDQLAPEIVRQFG